MLKVNYLLNLHASWSVLILQLWFKRNGIQSLSQNTKYPTCLSNSTSISILYLGHEHKNQCKKHIFIRKERIMKEWNQILWLQHLWDHKYIQISIQGTCLIFFLCQARLIIPSKFWGCEYFGCAFSCGETLMHSQM